MSKIGRKPIDIPQGVEINEDKGELIIKGPKGSLTLDVRSEVSIEVDGERLIIKKNKLNNQTQALWGLYRSLINNMILGVTQGYEKKLELQGVGYRMNVQGRKVNLALGFSHPVEMEIPEGIEVKVEENNILSISGINKQGVGQFAANIRKMKPVEPYKGKGFRYQGEKVRRKVGKKAAAK